MMRLPNTSYVSYMYFTSPTNVRLSSVIVDLCTLFLIIFNLKIKSYMYMYVVSKLHFPVLDA